MKKIKIYYIILFLVSLGIFSCNEDFLERYPLDTMSDATFFTKSSDLKSYMNGMYGQLVRRVSQNRWRTLEDGSDNFVAAGGPHSSLMMHSASGTAGETSNTWNNNYDYIRKVNYFLENSVNVPESDIGNHYIGEGYYARAFTYFNLLQEFGGVPYINSVLNVDGEELYSGRESRDFIAEKIIADLDLAIAKLHWKGEGEAKAQRLNKETAIIMKARVGLYEGSWEYYHGQKSTPFKTDGKDGSFFLNKAVEAGQMLIDSKGGDLYKGRTDWEYFDLFNKKDYHSVTGAYFYFAYNLPDQIFNGYWEKIQSGSHGGLTLSAIDAYLMLDGKPEEISSVALNRDSLASYGNNKDPRLRQTVYTPDRGTMRQYFDNEGGGGPNVYAGLTESQDRHFGTTGIKVWKGQSFDPMEWRDGTTDDLIIRLAEGLLSFAEAKAMLGTITQVDLDKSVNVLRDRVNMPHINLGEVNGWSVTYSEKDGYDPGATNIVNEIRRERRIEFMLEGFRKTDLKRWALLDKVFNGTIPLGGPYKELADYWADTDQLLADGWDTSRLPQLEITLGVHYKTIGDHLNPLFRDSDFADENARGYYIDPGRDYLNSIPKTEIELYKEKGNVTLDQNPGWF